MILYRVVQHRRHAFKDECNPFISYFATEAGAMRYALHITGDGWDMRKGEDGSPIKARWEEGWMGIRRGEFNRITVESIIVEFP